MYNFLFLQICELIANGWIYNKDLTAKSSYVYSTSINIWIGFDFVDDIRNKVRF